MSSAPSPAFVLGVPRSGTTLLRVMLEGHPQLFSPPEMIIAPFETMQERKAHMEQRFWEKGGLRRALMELDDLDVDGAKAAENDMLSMSIPEVYAALQEKLGERILVDKCPHLCADATAMQRLDEWFPDARYVWIVRHPGSVIRSIENMPYAEVMLQGYGDDPRAVWARGNRTTQAFLQTIPQDRWTRVHYEDLVSDPKPSVQRLCDALGVPFAEAMLDPYKGERMREGPKGARAVGDPNMASRGKIDPTLATKWLAGFDPERVSEDTKLLAKELGYDLAALPRPPIAKVGQALDAFWKTASELEHDLHMPMDIDAVEGRRFLLRMMGASLDTFVEQTDYDRPRFFHAEGPHRKMFADCPDTDYLRAPIRLGDGATYRVWGRIPEGTVYTGVVLYRRGGRVGRSLSDVELAPDADGRFELHICAGEPRTGHGGVWLQGDGDETALMVRQYYTDRSAQAPVEVHIEKHGDLGEPSRLAAPDMAKQLERSERMLRSIFTRTYETYKLARVAALNRFIEAPGDQLFPTPDNAYRVCWYRIGDDQVMLVRGRFPQARYFGVCLYNAWLESLDYTRHTINLNHAQIEADEDGNFEVCIAHRDPGHANWLQTAGHNAGYVLTRALMLAGEMPEVETEILYEKEWAQRRDG